MAFVLQVDPIFKKLHDSYNKEQDAIVITTLLGQFRKKLCLNWLLKFLSHDPTTSLSLVITTLLNYTEHDSANVRVTAYSTLGALMLTTAPFNPRLFIKSFGVSVASRPVFPKSSIAIINMFVYLSRFVSPVHLQEFIIMVPVHEHFKADVSDFLKFLPLVIPLMTALPVSFHESILRTIVIGCGANPSSALINSVYLLVSLNKKSLTNYLKSLLHECNIQQAVSALGPILLSDDEMYKYLGDDGREMFFENAVAEMNKETPRFMEFECSCQTCYILLKRYRGTDKYNTVNDHIQKTLNRKFPAHFERLLLVLSTSIKGIFKEQSTSDSFKSAQLLSLGSLVVDNKDTIDCDEAAEVFMQFIETKDDLYCSLIESFGKCVNVLLEKCKTTTHIKLLKTLLTRKNKNWVHDMAVSNLIAGLNHKITDRLVPDLFELEVNRLLEFSVSPNKKLAESAMDSLCAIASYRNLSYILSLVTVSQWADENIVSRRFELLSKLARVFDFDEFSTFVPIAYECILFCESMAALSAIFKFLKYIKVTYLPEEIRDFCYRFIISSYESFTQSSLIIPNSSLSIPIPPTTFLESYDTDIVSNPTFDHKIVLGAIQSCLEFLCNLDKDVLVDTNSLFWICIYLIPLFDEVALNKAIELNVDKIVETPKLWEVILETFMSTSREEAAASCCKLFVETKCQIPPQVHLMIEKYLIEQRAADPDLLFFCFVIIDMESHEKAISTLPTMQKLIGTKSGVPLMFRLANVLGKSVVSFVDDDFVFALLTFANVGVAEAKQRVYNYINKHKYSEWNVYDDSLNKELLTFLKNEEKIVVSNLDELDNEHWIFALENRDIFELVGLEEYVFSTPGAFAKIKHAPLPPVEQRKFTFKEVEADKRASVLLEMKEQKLVKSPPLLISFFKNAKYVIDEKFAIEVFNYAKEDNQMLEEFMNYCLRVNIKLPLDLLLSCPACLSRQILPLTIRFAKTKVLELPEPIKEGIAKQTKSIEACDIIRSDEFQILEALAQNDPSYFLKFYQECPRFSSKNYKALIKLLPTVNFSGVTLNDIASQQLSVMSTFDSTKQKCVLFRFLAVCLSSLRIRRSSIEMRSIAALVTAMISDIMDGASDSMYSEFSNLLFILSQVSVMHDVMIEFINEFVKNTGVSFLYLNQSSVLVCIKRQTVSSLLPTCFLSALQYRIPSLTSSCLRGLTNFIQRDASQQVLTMMNAVISEITANLSEIARNIKTAACLLPFVSRLLMNQAEFGENHQLLMEFTSIFFSDQTSPCYEAAIPLLPQLVGLYPSMSEQLFSLNCINSIAADAIYGIFENNKEKVFESTIRLFRKNQCMELAMLIIDFTKRLNKVSETIETLKEMKKESNQVSLPFYVVLVDLIKTENPSIDVESLKAMINSC